jgi:general secretion pathway protein D
VSRQTTTEKNSMDLTMTITTKSDIGWTYKVHYFLRHSLKNLLLLALIIIQPAVSAPVTLNLNNADINALISSISEITGKNFIVDPRVKGRVTVISSKPMAEDEIYEVFLAILAVHGFAAIPAGNIIKIIPAAGAKQEDIPTVGPSPEEPADQVVTRVIQVQNIAAAQIVPILRPLIPPQGHLAAYPATNVLIVSDSAGNVERMADIIRRIDVASDQRVEVIPLQNASATEVVRTLTALEQGQAQAAQGGAGTPARLVADERTNSILMTADPASRLRLRTLIAHLDTPLEQVGNTQVVYLRYAKAKDLVAVLQGVSQQLTEGQQQKGAPPPPPPSQGGKEINIQADEATNALVITAPPDIIRSLKSVIAQLDIRRAQVLVEAAITEITSTKAAELGIQWAVDARQDGVVAGTNLNTGVGSLDTILRALISNELPTSPLPLGLTAIAGDFDGRVRFGALIRALANSFDTNILSTPTLVTLDNEEAEIIVGQNVPFITGSFTTSTDSSTNPFQTIERQDVGLTLRVKPQINEGNAVKLEISQEVSSVQANTPQGIITRKRSIKTNVLVEDGQILVLGGLIQDNLDDNAQKVPGLGDLPLVGSLFRYHSTTNEKTNLMVFLHPVIVRDAMQGTLNTHDKYSYIRQQQFAARQKGVDLLPQVETPVLPSPEQVQKQNSMLNLTPPPAPKPKPKPSPAAPTSPSGFNSK